VKVIAISGKAQHGKDTFAGICADIVKRQGKRPLIIHYADYLKMCATLYFGWTGRKDEEGRTLLQQVGTERARNRNPDMWVNTVMTFLDTFQGEYDIAFIPDTRFPNEVLVPKHLFYRDCSSVRVVRPNFPSPLTEEQQNHPSETALDDFPFDFIVRNLSLESLEKAAEVLIDITKNW
jgi:hypothetical protein